MTTRKSPKSSKAKAEAVSLKTKQPGKAKTKKLPAAPTPPPGYEAGVGTIATTLAAAVSTITAASDSSPVLLSGAENVSALTFRFQIESAITSSTELTLAEMDRLRMILWLVTSCTDVSRIRPGDVRQFLELMSRIDEITHPLAGENPPAIPPSAQGGSGGGTPGSGPN